LGARGRELEAESPGTWLIDFAEQSRRPLVLDAVRTEAQRRQARERLPGSFHVHLIAPLEIRARRFSTRDDPADTTTDFDELAASTLEITAATLGSAADAVIDTADLPVPDVVESVLRALAAACA
jgi:hypothetical protein